jgi:cardiolipin synthase A/B
MLTDQQLFFEGDDLYESMLRDIDQARRRVWMESYIFAADRTGRRFADALVRSAERGLDTRLHVDAAGSLFVLPRRVRADLRAHGVQLREFHRWSWRDPWRYNRRNHCKLLILDDCRVYLGGFNIQDNSSRTCFGEQRWRDTHVRLDSEDLARQAVQLFETFWTRRVPRHLRWSRPPDLFRGDSLVSNRFPRHRHALRRLFSHGLRRARHRVWLTTPYFTPDRRTRWQLRAAARRGVDVRLLLPAVSDHLFVQLAARHIYRRLLLEGLRIFEYSPRVLHAKTVVVDGTWASIGTANVDHRSFFHNYEINFVTDNGDICGVLEEQFEVDLGDSVEITMEDVHRMGWWSWLGGHIAWRLRRWF